MTEVIRWEAIAASMIKCIDAAIAFMGDIMVTEVNNNFYKVWTFHFGQWCRLKWFWNVQDWGNPVWNDILLHWVSSRRFRLSRTVWPGIVTALPVAVVVIVFVFALLYGPALQSELWHEPALQPGPEHEPILQPELEHEPVLRPKLEHEPVPRPELGHGLALQPELRQQPFPQLRLSQ